MWSRPAKEGREGAVFHGASEASPLLRCVFSLPHTETHTHTQASTDNTRAGMHTQETLPRDPGTRTSTHTLMDMRVHVYTRSPRLPRSVPSKDDWPGGQGMPQATSARLADTLHDPGGAIPTEHRASPGGMGCSDTGALGPHFLMS